MFKRALFNPVGELIYLTLFFGAVTFAFFWLTIKWQLLPTSLLQPYLTQESTGLFDALGGWALGFAGALVAIRIAGVAKKIQENDSIREHVNLWEKHVDRISELNSKLTRSITDTKRACAAVLLYTKEVSRVNNTLTLNNAFTSIIKQTKKPEDIADQLQKTLEEKLEILIETIEEAFKDSVYRSVLGLISKTNPCSDKSRIRDEDFASRYFQDQATREDLINIVSKDTEFFNILEIISSLGAKNFGIGLMELRAMPLFEHFYKDLMRITSFQKEDSKQDNNHLEIADAAWILLGLLLSRNKPDNSYISQNDGFVILALILGSLPTEEVIKTYLDTKKPEVFDDYSAEGRAFMQREISELAKRLFYVKAEELSEISSLIEKCNNNLSYLDVMTKSTGVSSEQNKAKLIDENSDLKGTASTLDSFEQSKDKRIPTNTKSSSADSKSNDSKDSNSSEKQ